nr:hypothetical protein [Candidatus Enterousia merdequi]
MKVRILFFLSPVLLTPTFVYGACSVANLTRCLDSACAINIGANPAARCQYCGSASAGEPEKSTAMKSISAGASAKYNISDKELKKAPTDPGERYVWATQKCLEKLSECTPDDVTDNYDTLIEQSCKAAGISAEMASLSKKVNTAKTQSSCNEEITACVIDTKRCMADYRNCESDESFDKYLSECSVISTGCEPFLSDIRTTLSSERKTTYANAEKVLQSIITAYQTAREQKLISAQSSCKNNKSKESCVTRVCANNMRNKCEKIIENGQDINQYERTIAENLCKFYDIACDRLK